MPFLYSPGAGNLRQMPLALLGTACTGRDELRPGLRHANRQVRRRAQHCRQHFQGNDVARNLRRKPRRPGADHIATHRHPIIPQKSRDRIDVPLVLPDRIHNPNKPRASHTIRSRGFPPKPHKATISSMLNSGTLPKAADVAPSAIIEALAALGVGEKIPRDAALGVFRRHLARIQQHVQYAFEQDQINGLAASRMLGKLVDGLIRALYDHTVEQLGRPEALSVAATGGYGRGTLAPFSDIDLLFLTPGAPSAHTLQAVEYMLYFLWDLGLKVGHATRSIAECLTESARDTTIRTALLDGRHVAGEADLFGALHASFRAACKEAGAAGFVTAKQAEREVRHRRYGDSPYVVEPNVKEGRGGLRDLQTLYWIARYLFGTETMGQLAEVGGILSPSEARHGRRSWEFLWTVRFHLHYVAGRAEERLTFDLQPVVGARMGYTRHGRQDGVERFMRHYFLTVREVVRLTRVVEPAVLRAALGAPAVSAETDPALRAAGFVLAEGQLLPAPGREFEREPIQMLRILQVARDRKLELHPLAIHSLTRNERGAIKLRGDKAAADLFMDLLCGADPEHVHSDGARWLAVLNEAGFLGYYMPDWGRIVGQMQFDTYHVYTVDEHTVEAVGVLTRSKMASWSRSLRSLAA